MFTADDDKAVTIPSPAPATALARTAACVMSAETAAVPALRGFARGVVRSWALSESVDEAVALIVTELVANAVKHSDSPDVAVLISLEHRAVSVEVKDRGQWRPASAADRLDGPTESCSGRGLSLVNAYSSGCVLWCGPQGTRVVAEVPLAHESR